MNYIDLGIVDFFLSYDLVERKPGGMKDCGIKAANQHNGGIVVFRSYPHESNLRRGRPPSVHCPHCQLTTDQRRYQAEPSRAHRRWKLGPVSGAPVITARTPCRQNLKAPLSRGRRGTANGKAGNRLPGARM